MLENKTSINIFKKTEIISRLFSKHNGVKLEINYKKRTGNFTNMWRLNNMFLNNEGSKKKSKDKSKKYLETNENGNTYIKAYGIQQKQFYSGSLQY